MRLGIAVLIVCLAFVLSSTPTSAKEYYIDRAYVSCRINPDASVDVEENITYGFRGYFTSASMSFEKSDWEVSGVQVLDDGTPAKVELTDESNRTKATWRYEASNEERTFTIRYHITKGVRAYSDVGEFNWKFPAVGSANNPKELEGTIILPARVNDPKEVHRWGHKFNGTITMLDNDKIVFQVFDTTGQQPADIRVVFPRYVIPTPTYALNLQGPGLRRIIDEEKAALTYEDMAANASHYQTLKSVIILCFVVFGVLLVILANYEMRNRSQMYMTAKEETVSQETRQKNGIEASQQKKWRGGDVSRRPGPRPLSYSVTDASSASLVISNVLTAFLAITEGWSTMTLIWIYWLQSVIIGFFNVVRMLKLKDFSTEGLKMNDRLVKPTQATKVSVAGFFALHYGFFHLVYAIFLVSFSSTARGRVDGWEIALGGLIFFANHLFSYIQHQNPAKKPNIGNIMFFPYIRIIPMHLTIIFGGMLLATDSSSLPALILFLGLKTVADLVMHAVEHSNPMVTSVSCKF